MDLRCTQEPDIYKKIYQHEGYLNIDACKDRQIIPYQIDMISKNNISGLSKFHIMSDCSTVKFIYDMSGSTTIGKYLMNKPVQKQKFVFLIKKIFNIISNCKSYLLCENNFILRPDTVFIDKQDDIKLVYLPCEINTDFNEQMRHFILDTVTQYVQFSDDYDNTFFMQLIYLLRNKSFNIVLFEDYLMQHFDDDEGGFNECNELNYNNREEKENKLGSKKYKRINALHINIILFSIYAFICIAIFVLLKDQVSDRRFLLSLLMLFAGVGVLISKKMFGSNISTNNTINEHDNDRPILNNSSSGNDNASENSNERMIASDSAFKNNYLAEEQHTQILSPEMLSEGKHIFYGLMESREGNPKEVVTIDKEEFYVGRLINSVDYVCKSKAVGKMHAKFVKTDEGYCVEDLRSRNGTFINGSRLLPELPYPLKNGDIIRFADVEFMFSHSWNSR